VSIKINWSVNLAVDGGPKISQTNEPEIKVDAYDLVTATLPAGSTGAGAVSVDLQPSGTAGDVVLLAMTSKPYDATLTYEIGGGGTKGTLDGPLLLVGAGAVALLGATPPGALKFENPLAKVVDVQILVGRTI
jgi:hypothetical protein